MKNIIAILIMLSMVTPLTNIYSMKRKPDNKQEDFQKKASKKEKKYKKKRKRKEKNDSSRRSLKKLRLDPLVFLSNRAKSLCLDLEIVGYSNTLIANIKQLISDTQPFLRPLSLQAWYNKRIAQYQNNEKSPSHIALELLENTALLKELSDSFNKIAKIVASIISDYDYVSDSEHKALSCCLDIRHSKNYTKKC